MICCLDLDVLMYPCPQGGPTFRPQAVTKGGKSRFPYMDDPNTGIAMYESDEIIQYLADTYGDGSVPLALQLGLATDVTASLSGIGRYAPQYEYCTSRWTFATAQLQIALTGLSCNGHTDLSTQMHQFH